MISSHDDWLTESDLDILLLPVVRGDDGSEGILDDARLGVGGPSVDGGQGSVLSREPSRPLHHLTTTHHLPDLLQPAPQPAVQVDLEDDLRVEDVTAGGEEDEPQEDVDHAAHSICFTASGPKTDGEDGHETEIEGLEEGPGHEVGQDSCAAGDVAEDDDDDDESGTGDVRPVWRLVGLGGERGPRGVLERLLRSDRSQSDRPSRRFSGVVGAAGLSSPPARLGSGIKLNYYVSRKGKENVSTKNSDVTFCPQCNKSRLLSWQGVLLSSEDK